ncbi:unnamed protein product [Sphagnum jensenii]|uniref:Uncharacterized protein n=1 Tax=Sphagnum jensenii TaxID=128206 RepID=A0ABP0VDR1_9BRYO
MERTTTQVLSDVYFQDIIRILSAYEGNGELLNLPYLFNLYGNGEDEGVAKQPKAKKVGVPSTGPVPFSARAMEYGGTASDAPSKRRVGRPPNPFKSPPAPKSLKNAFTPSPSTTPILSDGSTVVYACGGKLTLPAHIQEKLNGDVSMLGASSEMRERTHPSWSLSLPSPLPSPPPPSSVVTHPPSMSVYIPHSNRWDASLHLKYYRSTSSLPKLDVKRMGYWFCQVWYNLRLERYTTVSRS